MISEHRLIGLAMNLDTYKKVAASGTKTPSKIKTPLRPTQGLQPNQTGGYTDVADVQAAQQQHYIQTGSSDPALEAYEHNLTERLTKLQNGGDKLPPGVEDPVLIAEIRASNAAEATEIQKQLDMAQKKKAEAAGRSAASSAATQQAVQNPVTGQSYSGAAGQRLQGRLDDGSAFKSPQDQQDYIESRRAEGASDAEIRQEIAKIPKYQGEPSVNSPDAPGSTKPDAKGKTAGGAKGSPQGQQDGGQMAAMAPAPNPDVAFLRSIAAMEDDPIQQAIILREADKLEAMAVDDLMSQSEFRASDEAKDISKEYDATDKILNDAKTRAERSFASQDAFLKSKFERDEKLLASKEQSIKNQLAFQKDKALRDQTEANRKNLDSQSIMLALQGGFGSTDGNREISEARLRGEEALIDLTKEFGFKDIDVSNTFTEMHNQASDIYTQNWLSIMDNFEAKVGDLDLQGISNQAAKKAALSSAYSDMVKEHNANQKELAKRADDATKMVYDAIQAKREEKRWEQEFNWQKDSWQRNFDAQADERALRREESAITAGVRADEKEIARFDKKISTLRSRIDGDDTMKQYRDAKMSWDSLTAAYTSGDNAFKDRAMAKSYEKLVEVTSVVMPGEYQDITGAAPLANKISGSIGKVLNGGQAWTDEERDAIKDLSEQLYNAYKGRYDTQSQGYLMEIDAYNSDVSDPDNIIYPSMLGLPESTTGQQRSTLDQMWNDGEEGPFSFSGPAPKVSSITSKDLTSGSVGGKKITGQPFLVSALTKADQEFFAATGKHIQVNDHFRDSATQARLYKELSKKGARVAPPGSSFHEKGLAIDVANWKEAQPYLTKHGLVNGLPGDMGHFSFGEMNPEALSHFTGDGHSHA